MKNLKAILPSVILQVPAAMLVTLLSMLVVALPARAVDSTLALKTALGADRLKSDLRRDPASKPEVVIPLLKLKEGDSVVDLFAGGGYYSELLSNVVGTKGEVVLYNNKGYEEWGVTELARRFNPKRQSVNLTNITRHVRELDDMALGESAFDAALIVLAYHDLYFEYQVYDGEKYVSSGHPAPDVGSFMKQLHKALKPGARLVVVDHAAVTGSGSKAAQALHRIDESFAIKDFVMHGFKYIKSDYSLRNTDDDRTAIVFDEEIKRKTDRFILVFEK